MMGHGGHSSSAGRLLHYQEQVAPDHRIHEAESSSSSSTLSKDDLNYIEHEVTKFDTLAGIAIKYGVEVSDIKRMNGLTADLHMFALKTLRIPLPGRHPPSALTAQHTNNNSTSVSSSASSKSEETEKTKKSDKKPVSLGMSLLRGYYGLPTNKQDEGTEMAVYSNNTDAHSEFMSLPPKSNGNSAFKMSCTMQRGLWNADLIQKAEEGSRSDNFSGIGDLQQLRDVHLTDTHTEECSEIRKINPDGKKLTNGMTKTNSTMDASYCPRGSRGLSLRPKSGIRQSFSKDSLLASEQRNVPFNSAAADFFASIGSSLRGLMDKSGNAKAVETTPTNVRRSSSTSSLQDSGNISPINLSSFFAAKGDIQSLTASVSKPIFDSIPRPLNGRRNKAALD